MGFFRQENYEDDDLIKDQFTTVLNQKLISTVFQPIISLRDGQIYGYEALSRGPDNSNLHTPDKLFEYAQKYGKLWDLESLCRIKAIETASRHDEPIRLFINVNPNVMHDIKFRRGFTKEYLQQYSIDPENIIFEITEREAVHNMTDFLEMIQNYKYQDYKIAIDDMGAGYSGLNMISDIHPHFIKLDMNLIRDIDRDITKQYLVKGLAEFAVRTNTYLIAEGIETERELKQLIEFGVEYGQGFFIQKPLAEMTPVDTNVIQIICEANDKKKRLRDQKFSDIYVSNLCRAFTCLDPSTLIGEVFCKFEKEPSIPGFCIIENDTVIGVITRNELIRHLSGRYGYSLYANKAISVIMSREFLSVDSQNCINYVAKKAMQRETEKIYDFITVTHEDKYFGIITVKDLLEKSIQLEVNYAKHLNPLSELPGNVIIENQLEQCIEKAQEKMVLYIDIDNFKAYNDKYGFENGDRFIKQLSLILKGNASREDFIGHIGGDDFIVILEAEQAEEFCESVIREINDTVPSFYNQNDLDHGFIITKNRHGSVEKFPLLSISIAGTFSQHFNTVLDLSEHIAQLKRMCKGMEGSNYLLRRHTESLGDEQKGIV